MAIPFNDNIQLNATPSENSHVVTKGYVDSAVSGGGGSYTLPTASDTTLGGVKINGNGLSINSSSGVVSVVDRAYSTALAPAYSQGTTYPAGSYFTYEGELYKTVSTYQGMPPIGMAISTAALLSKVTVVSEFSALSSSVSSAIAGKANYMTGTISIGTSQWMDITSGTFYWNTNNSRLYLKAVTGIDNEEILLDSSLIYVEKGSAVTYAGSSDVTTITLFDNKTIYPLSVSGNVELEFDVSELAGTWSSSREVTFELLISVTGSSDRTVSWPANVEWLGDATSDGTELTTLTHGRTYYFVFRSMGGPASTWNDYVSETRWIGNLQGSISNSAS